jgi:hypothetical protein
VRQRTCQNCQKPLLAVLTVQRQRAQRMVDGEPGDDDSLLLPTKRFDEVLALGIVLSTLAPMQAGERSALPIAP